MRCGAAPAPRPRRELLQKFLDPVCMTDCPLEAQEFRQAGQLLGADALRRLLAAGVDFGLCRSCRSRG